MAFWTVERIAEALSERAGDCSYMPTFRGDQREIRGICTDTRAIQPGDCFVALVGERFDAHDFLAQAEAAGAAALLVSRPLPLGAITVPVFVVDDTTVALGDLARYYRRAWGKPIVAVAGSNGKTTTKELIRAALGSVYDVHATSGNFNNRIGVPLTLLAIPPHADLAVVEAGTSLPGEIAILRAIIEPDIAVMTWIAEEHLERLGDLDGVLREESDIFDGVQAAITPSAQPHVADAAKGRAHRIVQAGLDTGDIIPDRWRTEPDGTSTLVIDGTRVHIPLLGAHNLRNTMLALAVARECAVSFDDAARGVATIVPPPMRGAWTALGSATVINDAYNANPASMLAALELLETRNSSQRVAVLGSMRELGSNATQYHDDVARAVLASPAELIAVLGEMADAMERVGGAADPRVVLGPDVAELWPRLAPRLERNATILLKASRGVRLERMLPYLTTWANQ